MAEPVSKFELEEKRRRELHEKRAKRFGIDVVPLPRVRARAGAAQIRSPGAHRLRSGTRGTAGM